MATCEDLVLAGESYWRLPSAFEVSMANINGLNEDLEDFAPSYSVYIWTSDESYWDEERADSVSFDYDSTFTESKSAYNYVLCTNKI